MVSAIPGDLSCLNRVWIIVIASAVIELARLTLKKEVRR